MKTITLLGEEVKIDFSMAVEIDYEEQTGDRFAIDNNLIKNKNMMALGWAAVKTYNPETKLTRERIAMECSAEEIKMLNDAVVETMVEWLKIPALAESEQPDASDDSEGN